MKKYKIIVSYDGTNYHGWQIQPNKITIAGTLEKRFKEVFGKDITITGSSRTDTGVHALGQVAQFSTDLNIEKSRLLEIFNNSLPKDILIKKIEIASDKFHVRHNVSRKTYHYYIFKERPSVFLSRYGYFYPQIDINKFEDNLQVFWGTHDFRSFCTGYEKECTIRTIDSIKLRYIKSKKAYRVEVTGKGFLRHMVRRIVGGALDPRFNKLDLLEILNSKNNNQKVVTAPAHGLLLYKVDYKIKQT